MNYQIILLLISLYFGIGLCVGIVEIINCKSDVPMQRYPKPIFFDYLAIFGFCFILWPFVVYWVLRGEF